MIALAFVRLVADVVRKTFADYDAAQRVGPDVSDRAC